LPEIRTMRTLLFVSVLLNGLIAGGALDKALMELPARKKIGYRAFFDYFRATDLGPGIVFYPLLGLAAPVVPIIAAITAHTTTITVAAYFAIGHVVSTAGAISNALQLRTGIFSDNELGNIFHKFALWNGVRVICLLLAFLFSLLALVP
jgi:hypothetical protein